MFDINLYHKSYIENQNSSNIYLGLLFWNILQDIQRRRNNSTMHYFCLLKIRLNLYHICIGILSLRITWTWQGFFGSNTKGMLNSSNIKISFLSNNFFNLSSYFFGLFSAILRRCSVKVTTHLYGDNKTIYLRYIFQINKPGILENINTFTQATERGSNFVGSKRVGSPLMKTQFKVE